MKNSDLIQELSKYSSESEVVFGAYLDFETSVEVDLSGEEEQLVLVSDEVGLKISRILGSKYEISVTLECV